MVDLRDIWEETSFNLEKLQANPECVTQEAAGLRQRKEPPYKLTFNPDEVLTRDGMGGMGMLKTCIYSLKSAKKLCNAGKTVLVASWDYALQFQVQRKHNK